MAAGAPVSAARAAPPDLYEQGRVGTACGGAGEGEETGTRWDREEVERKGTRPRSVTAGAETWPRSPDRGDDAGPARRPTSSITRRTAAGACCQGRMKSSPREARLLFSTNTRHSGSGDSRSGRGAADPRPFPHSAVLRSHTRTFGLPPWSGRISPVPGPAWPSNFVCSSHCLYSRLIFPGLFVKKANFSLQSTNSSLKPSLKQRKSDLPK